jgi:hypothetical protein
VTDQETQAWPARRGPYPVGDGEPGDNGKPEEPGGDSVLEAIRARRKQLDGEQTLVYEVPGYGGLLALELGPIHAQQMTQLRVRRDKSKSPERDFNLNCDMVLAATRQVLGRARRSDGWRALDPDGVPVRIDGRLGELLQFEPEPGGGSDARSILRFVFRMANSVEFAVQLCAGEYTDWAASASEETEEELLGES